MSDTTGWTRTRQGGYEKSINNYFFEIKRECDEWDLWYCIQYAATRATLRECQRLAHATARLWAGE